LVMDGDFSSLHMKVRVSESNNHKTIVFQPLE
jgi:hypothetical protein